MGFLDNLLSTGAQITGIEKSRQALLDAGSAAQTGAAQVGGTAAGMAQFKPFTVTGGTGSLTTTPEGGFGMQLSPQQQAIQNNMFGAAGNLSAQIGQPANPLYGQMSNQAYGQAQGFLGQVGQIDPRMQAQRSVFSGMFGQQAGQYGQPTGLEGITQQALGQGQQQLSQAQQPADLNLLRGQYANQVSGLLGQQPSNQFGQLASQASQAGLQGLQNLSAPQDIEALRSQYAGLAGQSAAGLGSTNQVGRQQDIYNQLRAMQTPEEERQRLALEERLQAQGRGGIQTAQYGGTPEQLAMAKAQAEAQNQAGMMAMQQAGSEQDRAYQQALGLAGQASQFAGMSSDLQSASQQRASQLSQLGMTAEEVQSQLQSEGLSRGIQAGTAAGQLAGVASNLESAGIDRGTALSQLGMVGTEQTQAMGAERLRQLMALQQQDIGSASAQQALQQGNLGLAGGLFDYGTASSMQPGQMTQQQLQLQAAMMGAGYAPEDQMLRMLAGGTQVGQLADLGRREAAKQYAEANMSGLEGMLQSRQGSAELSQQYYNALAALAGSQNQQGQSMTQQVGGYLSNLLGGGGGGGGGNVLSNLPVFSGGDNSISGLFGGGLADYLGGATQGGGGYSFGGSMSDLFDTSYGGGTTTADGGTFFGSGSGTGYDFGSTFNPYDTSSYIGGGGLLDYDSSNAFTMPSGGG
jgi:hypothetical protein